MTSYIVYDQSQSDFPDSKLRIKIINAVIALMAYLMHVVVELS